MANDEEFEDDEELEDGEFEDEELEEEAEAPPAKAATPAATSKAAPSASSSEKPHPIKNMPLTLTVEVGRIKITAAQLMGLQPGSMLELQVDPAGALDITAAGTCVGKGELIKVGDLLGIRVVEIG